MVTVADGKYSEGSAQQSVGGDMLCLLSAVTYGAYTVSIRWVGWQRCIPTGLGCVCGFVASIRKPGRLQQLETQILRPLQHHASPPPSPTPYLEPSHPLQEAAA